VNLKEITQAMDAEKQRTSETREGIIRHFQPLRDAIDAYKNP
jgi:hypothetical protein